MSVLFIVCLLYLLLFSEGWFSWKEIHPIEKQMLATFFDGKSERRTPEIYLGIRNSIMRKFHFNPEVHLEKTDLSELSIGEMDARLEILEFLAHWGLVNFHPCPPVAQDCKLIESKSSADTAEEIYLIEKLFQFETVHSYLVPVSKKAEIIAPVQFTSFLSQPKLAEDAITAAESSVEYHCNSCSVDCSRKRYHCRTQRFLAPVVLTGLTRRHCFFWKLWKFLKEKNGMRLLSMLLQKQKNSACCTSSRCQFSIPF